MCLKSNELKNAIWKIQLRVEQRQRLEEEIILSAFYLLNLNKTAVCPYLLFHSPLTIHSNTQILIFCEKVFHRKKNQSLGQRKDSLLQWSYFTTQSIELFGSVCKRNTHLVGGRRMHLKVNPLWKGLSQRIFYRVCDEIHFPQVALIMQKNVQCCPAMSTFCVSSQRQELCPLNIDSVIWPMRLMLK